jgi:glutamate racemase
MLDAPIGIFDSGVGGLSVLKAIRRALPDEHLIYVADSANAPYGNQDAAFITERTNVIARFLVAAQAKALVVACNTATVVAVEALRAWCPVPVIAMEPAIKPAVQGTTSGVVGVLATSHTVASASVARLCSQYGSNARILMMACPGLVECVERGERSGVATRSLLSQYIAPLLNAGMDTLVIGCTHYSFLIELMRDIVGPKVTLVDPAAAVARELTRRLGTHRRPATQAGMASERFVSSGSIALAQPVMSALWGENIIVHRLDVEGQRAETLASPASHAKL